MPEFIKALNAYKVSTHSRAKAADESEKARQAEALVSTHSRAKAAECHIVPMPVKDAFQHTAARRRLIKKRVITIST